MTADQQTRLHRDDKMKAVRETIRICKEQGILKEYLEKRAEEVENIMFSLFDQEHATAMMLASERKDAKAEGIVMVRQSDGASFQDIVATLQDKLSMSPETAEKTARLY